MPAARDLRRVLADSAGVAALVLAAPGNASAQDTIARPLPAVVVTRDAARSPLDLPFAITTVQPDSLTPGQTHTQPEQTLSFIPGLTAANRHNPSQDARVSIRGFGARSPFGVRSIRVLRDGIPLTLPDGQTPIDYLDLEAVGRVETIRGTASAMYGNASGGVVDLRSAAPPSAPAAVQARSWAGENGLRRYTGLVGGTVAGGSAYYQGNIGRTIQEGARDYARQRLTNAFVRAGALVRGVELTVIGLGLDMPVAENPGALTRAQFDADPTQADSLSVARRARKEVHQVQLGAAARRELASGDLLLQVYGSGRSLHNPLTFAIVGIDRSSGGASARATIPVRAVGGTQRLTFGIDAQRLDDARKNWANCNSVATPTANCPTVGVEQGRLTLDQREIVTGTGGYVRDEFGVGRSLVTLGVRADNTAFEVRDAFVTDGRDDSGKRSMRAVSPMIGVSVPVVALASVYANLSTAFETPTTTELGNQADGSAGLNPELQPQQSLTVEMGVKGVLRRMVRYDVAVYQTRVRDELVPFDIGSGRTAFRNAGRTLRRGAEAALLVDAAVVSWASAYTYSRFRFADFVTGTTQHAGNTIPGIPEHQFQTSLTARTRRAFAVMEWTGKSRVFVNDANAAAAPGYALVNLRVGASAPLAGGQPRLMPVLGVQNVFDRKYVASVAVNAAGTPVTAKYYEPGPGRTWLVGLTASTAAW